MPQAINSSNQKFSTLVCVEDYEKEAAKIIPKDAFDYYRSGAGDETTLSNNIKAFRRLRIRPLCLRDVSEATTNCKLFGTEFNMPIGVAPTAMQKMSHEDGEIGNARAAGKAGCIFILSTLSTTSLEDVAKGAPDTYKWFQLYIYKDRSLTESMIRRAEAAGYKGIVLTVDAQKFGMRRADLRNKFKLPSHLGLANFTGELFSGVKSDKKDASGINDYVNNQFDLTISWKDVDWLVKFAKIPVIVKGVLREEDAILAVEYGCSGIIVSNHGGRQIDSVPASIEALPGIVKAVGNKIPVMLDGGIRQGPDVFKALALGAKMVFIGRPLLWGLALNGQEGAEDVLSILQKDLLLTMQLSGCNSVEEIGSDMVVHESYFAKL